MATSLRSVYGTGWQRTISVFAGIGNGQRRSSGHAAKLRYPVAGTDLEPLMPRVQRPWTGRSLTMSPKGSLCSGASRPERGRARHQASGPVRR